MVALEEALRLRKQLAPTARERATMPKTTKAQPAPNHLRFKTTTAPADPREFAATQVAAGNYEWLRDQQAKEFKQIKSYLASSKARHELDTSAREELHKKMQRLASALNIAKQGKKKQRKRAVANS